MSYEDFFRSSEVKDTIFFDEGPRLSRSRTSRAIDIDSIDTAPIDGYRQGVEITQLKHFDAGIVKIHAGEPGHKLRKNSYGMTRNFRQEARFEELDYFNPVSFLRAQEVEDPSFTITFPIITGDNDQSENYIFDGIIEPLVIREIASFFSTEVPFQAHAVRGAIMGGNSDQTWASDQIVSVDYFEPEKQQIEFVDLVDLIGPSGSAPQPLNGYFNFEKSTRRPFDDSRYPRNTTLSTNYDDEMNSALSLMSGSTDNYVSFKQKSSGTGFCYDNMLMGTDSVAFGGMTY